MSQDGLDQLRNYARKSAAELVRAGVKPDQFVQVVSTTRQVSRTAGWLRKRTVTEAVTDSQDRVHHGWMLWSQVLTMKEYHTPTHHEGWNESRQIWLAIDGTLMSVEDVDRWSAGSSPQQPNSVTNAVTADDDAITLADEPWGPVVYSPKTPRRPNGLYESHAKYQRGGKRLPPGRRISQRITELRKARGTYVQRHRPPKR